MVARLTYNLLTNWFVIVEQVGWPAPLLWSRRVVCLVICSQVDWLVGLLIGRLTGLFGGWLAGLMIS